MEIFQKKAISNIIETWKSYTLKKLNTIHIELGTNSSISYIETEDKIKCIVPNEECYRRLSNELNRQIALKRIKENKKVDKVSSERPKRISKLLNSKINKQTKGKNKPRHFKDER